MGDEELWTPDENDDEVLLDSLPKENVNQFDALEKITGQKSSFRADFYTTTIKKETLMRHDKDLEAEARRVEKAEREEKKKKNNQSEEELYASALLKKKKQEAAKEQPKTTKLALFKNKQVALTSQSIGMDSAPSTFPTERLSQRKTLVLTAICESANNVVLEFNHPKSWSVTPGQNDWKAEIDVPIIANVEAKEFVFKKRR